MKYFKPPFDKESIERQYKELAKKHHPDKGGSKEAFQEMNQEKKTILEAGTYFQDNSTFAGGKKKIRMKRKHPHRKTFTRTTNITFTIDPKAIEEIGNILKAFFK